MRRVASSLIDTASRVTGGAGCVVGTPRWGPRDESRRPYLDFIRSRSGSGTRHCECDCDATQALLTRNGDHERRTRIHTLWNHKRPLERSVIAHNRGANLDSPNCEDDSLTRKETRASNRRLRARFHALCRVITRRCGCHGNGCRALVRHRIRVFPRVDAVDLCAPQASGKSLPRAPRHRLDS